MTRCPPSTLGMPVEVDQGPMSELPGVEQLEVRRMWPDGTGHADLLWLQAPAV